MGDYLKNPEFLKKFQVSQNQEQQRNVKRHYKNPQQGFVPADGRKKKRIRQRIKPLGLFFGKNLQC
jgi:hypothetical protein